MGSACFAVVLKRGAAAVQRSKMSPSPRLGLALRFILLCSASASATNEDSKSPEPQSPKYEGMVAMRCPDKDSSSTATFQNKFLTKKGKWETDYGVKSTCKRGKINILEYCKQVYPDKNIVNVIESSKYEKIDDWCKSFNMKCRGAPKWVKPYRCIESPPQNSSEPPQLKKDLSLKDEYYYEDDYLDEDDDEYYYDEDDDDYDDDDDEDYYDDDDQFFNEVQINDQHTKIDKQKINKQIDTLNIDPYYTHYSPGNEHEEFTKALERAEEKHRATMTKVMKEWTEVEEKYESLAKTDREHADKLKQEMSDQFEKRIKNLENENEAEKDQLIAMHQQRVVSRINQRKEDAMKCYTDSLNAIPVSYPKVRECLEKLLRALHKDRHHTLAHYKNMVETTPAKADQQKEVTLQHLTDIDRIVNEGLSLLDRFPDLRLKLLPLMEDFLIELRSRDETPTPLFSMDRAQEAKVLDGFRAKVVNNIQQQEEKSREEKRRLTDYYKKLREEEKKEKEIKSRIELNAASSFNYLEDTRASSLNYLEDRVVQSNAQAHKLTQDQPGYSVTGMVEEESRLGYISLLGSLALLVLVVLAVLLNHRKKLNIRSHQGFLEVPTYSSPEDKHLSTMQANGYENPTYKYFEATVA